MQLNRRQASYTYDTIYRLTREEVTGDPANNGAVYYSYDPVGNRTDLSSTLGPIASATYSYDLNDRLLADTYDNNGNTLASGGDTFSYDFEDRLIDFNSGQVVNVYDGDGNRVARSEAGGTTLYLVDDRNPTGFAQVVDEFSGGTIAATYALGPQRASQTRWAGGVPTTSYYAHDGLGSVRLLTDSAGAVTDTYGCEAFGNGLSQTGTTTNPTVSQASNSIRQWGCTICGPGGIALQRVGLLRQTSSRGRVGRSVYRWCYLGSQTPRLIPFGLTICTCMWRTTRSTASTPAGMEESSNLP